MAIRQLFMAAGAAALVLATGPSAEAKSWRTDNPAGIAQPAHARTGGANRAGTSQRGNRNAASFRHSGSGNGARTLQRGNDNQAAIVQTGEGNRGRILQVGDGLDASLHQQGGERSNIIQVNRGSADVDIRTGPGGRRR